MTDAALADALAAWLPSRRWFAGKARTAEAVDVVDTAAIGDDLRLVVAEVTYADGGAERYFAPLASATAESSGAGGRQVVARIDGRAWIDAAADPAACRRLAAMALAPDATPTASGASLVGRPLDARGEPAGDPRPLRAEQSNTSIVFGNRSILKLFRKLEPGINPDVELTRGLTEAGFEHAPAQHGALELVRGSQTTALAVLATFIADAREGWDLALRDVYRGGGDAAGRRTDHPHTDSGSDREETLLPRVGDLGEAVAKAHAALADRFGRRAASASDVSGWVSSMIGQTESVLRTTAERAPEQAAAVLERRDDLLERFAALRQLPDPGPLVRIHGDLHLGQVVLDRAGVWQLLDFEGEPARPLSERRAPHSPARDVAGMLRSFDYAAAHPDPTAPVPPAIAAWRDEARARFLEGYRAVARPAGLLPADPSAEEALLAVFELDKAVYELGYELASRPNWVPIPAGGILRVLSGAAGPLAGRQHVAGEVVDPTGGPAVSPTTPEWRAPSHEVDRLLAGAHIDPHAVLGAHEVAGGAVVRALRPDAEGVAVDVGDGRPVTAERTDDRGFFEAQLDHQPKPHEYRLRVTYPGGASYDLRDPYAFWPSLGEIDIYLAGEGRHEELWRRMGAHVVERDGVPGVTFAVWAPNAQGVRVVGDFNSWDGRLNPMRMLGSSGIWELFVPEVSAGARYKYEIVTRDGTLVTRADPYAFATERPPGTASRIHESTYEWNDDAWLAQREDRSGMDQPMSVYEVHLGSWRHHDGTPLGYRDLAHALADHLAALHFTHVELLPVAEHPFGGSWGYQVTGYFAPTARFGDPDDFRYFVDHLHRRGIGVIVDWVPAHFPRDEWALARFDGTALYEHADPRQGAHPDWGTLVFNYGRNEVRNFLIANALYWIEELHIDGLRVDAVASMLYLDYSRKQGEWVPNQYGGRENLDAVEFLKELNAVVHGRNPGTMMIAEESTAWPGVSRPVHLGGLGFGYKWNMGWMHDTLSYFAHDPIHRRYHHHELTFALMYAWSENFILPLSHDEVVHGKRSLLDKMPGDRWQKFANLRSLYGYMWAHPGKQMLFMGGEFGQWQEWSEERSLDWHLLGEHDHAGLQRLVADLNAVYAAHPALWQRDDRPEGFRWIDANDADNNTFSFVRYGNEGPPVACVANLSPVPRYGIRLGLPSAGRWRELLNTDASVYGGGDVGNFGGVDATDQPWHGMPASTELTLPPLGVLWLVADQP